MTTSPSVTVVIPAYNAEPFIAQALAGVLAQRHRDLECIVVDDGSTDATASIVSSTGDPRVRLVSPGRRGSVSAVRNIGIDKARGDLVAFHDADDVWHPDKLARQIDALSRQPDAGLIWCAYVITDAALGPLTEIRTAGVDIERWVQMEGNGIAMASTGVVPRQLLLEVGSFDERLSTSADAELALRLARAGRVIAVDEVLVAYRAHGGQMHLNLGVVERDMDIVLRERFEGGRRYRRARANLHTRLFAYHLRGFGLKESTRHLGPALRRPDRFVGLPIEALVRRTARQMRRARHGLADPREWLTS